MVIREESDHLLMVTQPAHAWISGQIAERWGGEHITRTEPWKEVCFAAGNHDAGWIETDRHPVLNPLTGAPYDFRNIPINDHLSIWEESVEQTALYSRYAALLVSKHVMVLFAMNDISAMPQHLRTKAEQFNMRQHTLQNRLTEDLKENTFYQPFLRQNHLEKQRRLLSVFDYLSLQIILGETETTTLDEVPSGDTTVSIHLSKTDQESPAYTLSPWPFKADRVTLRCDAIRLEDRCSGQEELDRSMERSSRELFTAELAC